MNVSFQPNGKWFVFNIETGETLQKDLPTKNSALIWLHAKRIEDEKARP